MDIKHSLTQDIVHHLAGKTSLQSQKPMAYGLQSFGTSSRNHQPHHDKIQSTSCQHNDAHSRHKSQINQRNHQLCNKIDCGKSETASLVTKQSTTSLKPYVPKRLRFITEERSSDSVSNDEKVGKTISDMFNIDPYIATERSREVTITKPPKQVLCNLNDHKGPATCVHWNIPQYSHLLLSSSMDKTVRLWDYSNQRCVQVLCCHTGAVKDAQWSSNGLTVLSCGFDKTARLSDAESGTNFQVFEHPSYVTCVRWHPQDPQIFISGTYGSTIYCWDTRTGRIAHEYGGRLGQILALEFINNGTEFVASCDTVSRDSADRTIMVWDAFTPALVSNQLYHEKYTCTSFKSHPTEKVFMAQSNANYIALFSTKRPYRLNKYKRFEGHQIEGYQIGCDFSPDGSMVVSGGADGQLYVYNYASSALIRSLGEVKGSACIDVAWHPVLPSVVASCSWDGVMTVWR